ncbi:tRNA-splicing endonuclease subunit Sen2 isoform 2-T12 [Polymixia lowei]
MEAPFQAPRHRARVSELYEGPFPVPRSEAEEDRVYRAELVHQHVLILDPIHIQEIYGKGYFGKGVLSRARPDRRISSQWEEYGGHHFPVVSHSKYEQLLNWSIGTLLAQGLDEEAVNQTLLRLSQPVELEDQRRRMGGGENGHREEEEKEETQGRTSLKEEGSKDRVLTQRKRLQSGAEAEPPVDPELQTKRACRQGDPRFDPLARDPEELEHSPLEPEPGSGSGLVDPGSDYVLVVCDGEEGEEREDCEAGRREVRINPFKMTEYLQLSLEEAFFLVYALGCLSIYHNQAPLSIMELWERFRTLQPEFESFYAAYHFYRSRAWVPKPGLKYGSDFILYRKGPPFYHASYSVVVERVGEAFTGAVLRPFSWRSLAALSRITANVSKEVIISRWISSRERAEQDDI